MAAILALGTASPARAGLVIQLSVDGTHWDTEASVASGTHATYSASSYHGFSISILSDDSNSPGTPSLAYLEGSAVHITNTNSGPATLYMRLSDVGFTTPVNPGPILLDSQIGGSVTVPGSHNSMTYQSYVDPADGLASATGFTPGLQAADITGTPRSYNVDASMWITGGLTSTYSITESFRITLDKNAQFGFQSSTNLMAVPEPAGLVLCGLGVVCVAGYSSLRRRTRCHSRAR